MLAHQVIEAGYRTVVAIGGDGTVHEVVNGFPLNGSGGNQVRLAVVPAGTGMDIARNLRIRRGILPAVQRLFDGRERSIDVGITTGDKPRRFVNFAETGIGAAVVLREEQIQRPMPGRLSFFLAALDAIRLQENVLATVKVDGNIAYHGLLVSVVAANGRYFGGGMKVAPRAEVDDGMLDILILGDFTRAQLVTQVWKIYPGIHVSHRKVAWLRGRTVDVEVETPTHLDLDGELLGPGPCRVSILNRSLTVVV
jgi:YegS/Rv2252/BmrU family lipid kinase